MDIPDKMDQLNQVSSSSLTTTRKRGRPRRDESQNQQQVNPPVTNIDDNLIGQVVSGVVEGSFEAGYFLNVKVADTGKQLRGIVFLPEKVTPVNPITDLFPQAKMYARKHVPVPSLNQQTPPQGKKDVGSQTDDIGSEPQTDNLIAERNQSATLPNVGVGSEAIEEKNDPMDTDIKDVGDSSAEEKINEPEGHTLSLMPQFARDDVPKEDHTVQRSEACAASKTGVTVTTTSPKHSIAEASTTLVNFFPARETSTMGSSSLSLEFFQKETKCLETEKEKSPAGVDPLGLDRSVEKKLASPVDDDVPEELQLELGNKKMSASAIDSTEANPDQSASSKTGLLAKEPHADPESGLPEPEATTQVDDNDS